MPLKRFVYILRSEVNPARHYVGLTSNVAARVEAHNAARSSYTHIHRPWRLVVALEFATQDIAAKFERYLKSGSGRAFAKRHFR